MILRPRYADPTVWSAPVDPTIEFQAGQIAGLIQMGGDIFITLANNDSVQPVGIFDDVRTKAFSGVSLDEIIIIPAVGVDNGDGVLRSSVDVMGFLQNTDIIESSFTSDLDLILNPKNGAITISAGTPLNFDDGTQMGFQVTVSYNFDHANYPGDDSTIGSNMATVHFKRGIFATNIFDTTVDYQPSGGLFVNPEGVLTSQETGSPMVALIINPPSSLVSELEFMWL